MGLALLDISIFLEIGRFFSSHTGEAIVILILGLFVGFVLGMYYKGTLLHNKNLEKDLKEEKAKSSETVAELDKRLTEIEKQMELTKEIERQRSSYILSK